MNTTKALSKSAKGSLVFSIDNELLLRRPPRLTVAGTLSSLCKQIKTGDLDANFVVDILNEKRLLPHMIGHSKNLFDISMGRETNASKIGDLIVSDECIRGTYELCISFLEFVLATICDPSYVDTTKCMLASIIYISNEIYTSHHIWTYKNIKDMNRILHLCTEIFHHIIANLEEPTKSHKYSEVEIVVIVSLSQNQAHKQLLDVIVDGRNNIRKSVEGMDAVNELNLRNSPTVVFVRQSLIMFNKLLTHGQFLRDYFDVAKSNNLDSLPSHCQHGASSSGASMTNLERALFDTSSRPALLHRLFSFIYEKDDSATACLAVDLIKKIGKKFSMSLMASLGSEADKVCEFFIGCLSDKEANVDLKVAILDLLSTCVKHQPGLIELLLNFQKDSKEVIISLLEECKTKQENAYKVLHTYVMKFVLTFWQKNHSAIEQFDKVGEFWDYVTFPLIRFLEPPTPATAKQDADVPVLNLDDELNSYALMILAREIFCLNAGISERKMNTRLQSILEEICKKNFLDKYSSFIEKKYLKISDNLDKNKDYNRLLVGWRDFLVSYAKYKPFEITDLTKNKLVEDLLTCLISELKLGEKLDKERVASVGETLLLIWTKWMAKNSGGPMVFESIHQLIYLADSVKEYLPFSFLLTFQTTLNLYLVRQSEYLHKSARSFDLLVPALQLFHFSLKVMETHLNQQVKNVELEYKPGVESRLCVASIMTLRFIIDASRSDVSLWNSYLETNLKTDSLIQFLSLLLSRRTGSEICLSLVELLLCLSTIQESAIHLNKAALISQVNMIAVSSYERPYTHLSQLMSTNSVGNQKSSIAVSSSKNDKIKVIGQQQNAKPLEVQLNTNPINAQANNNILREKTSIYLDNINSDHKWLPLYWHIIRLNISMMLTLGGDYMTTAIEFLSIHSIRICELLELLRTKPRSVNMEEALQTIYLINLSLRYSRMWKRKNMPSYEAISDEFGKTAYTLATSALPPPTTYQPSDNQQPHTSIKPRDCLVYARCCYDFAKYTEAERVLFQTKFGDKTGFIKEASQIYGEELSKFAFHLAALICIKTNRQADSIDFALQAFTDDPEYSDIVSALTQKCV